MKKKATKKLALNRQTMTNLSAEYQLALRGGGPVTVTGYGPCACDATKRCSGTCVECDVTYVSCMPVLIGGCDVHM
jgi:hypothetical protein